MVTVNQPDRVSFPVRFGQWMEQMQAAQRQIEVPAPLENESELVEPSAQSSLPQLPGDVGAIREAMPEIQRLPVAASKSRSKGRRQSSSGSRKRRHRSRSDKKREKRRAEKATATSKARRVRSDSEEGTRKTKKRRAKSLSTSSHRPKAKRSSIEPLAKREASRWIHFQFKSADGQFH